LLQNVLLSLFDAFFTVAFYQVFFKLIDDDTNPEFPDFIPNLVKAINFLIVKLIIGLILVFLIAIISSVYFINSPEIDTSNPFSWDLLPVFILIAIPIIFLTIRLCFVVCFIVDQESGSSESISQSWTITKGHFWLISLLFLVMLGLKNPKLNDLHWAYIPDKDIFPNRISFPANLSPNTVPKGCSAVLA
jgi:hypothetical protein